MGVFILEPVRLLRACKQGSLLFSKFEFSIKPDLRDLSFSYGGLRQFFIKCRQFAIKVRILCIYEV